MSCGAVSRRVVLCCVVLCWVLLCCDGPSGAVFSCVVLSCVVLPHIALCGGVLRCAALCCAVSPLSVGSAAHLGRDTAVCTYYIREPTTSQRGNAFLDRGFCKGAE